LEVFRGVAIARFTLRLLAMAPALAAAPGRAVEAPGRYSREAIDAKDYRGISLRVLSLEEPILGEPVERHAREFAALTGARVDVTHVQFRELYQEVNLGLKKRKYDVVCYGSMWIADLQQYLAPIPQGMLESAQYRDVLPHYQRIAKWGDVPYQVPVDGDRHSLQYRRDLLENPAFRAEYRARTGRELAVPTTWKELNEIARFFQGRTLPDGKRIWGLTEVTVSDALLGNQFIKRAAPYAKHPGVDGGFYFDLETMEPLVNTPGWVEALQDFVDAQDLYPPGGTNFSFFDVIKSFGRGDAVFSDSWDDPFVQAMERDSPLRNKVAVALSPGSRRAWNRRAGRWDEFPEANRVPYIAYGWTCAVARDTPHQAASFDFLGFFSNPENHAADLAVGRFGINPFRRSDLDVGFWTTRAGWDEVAARSYVETLSAQARARHRVLDLRIHLGQQYVQALAVGVYRALTRRESPQAALDKVAERWRELTRRVGVEKQREAYRPLVRFEDGQP
jgi:multiple sugar transport system substrate-binding protein